MANMDHYDSFISSKVDGMLDYDQMPDCPPSLVDPVKAAHSNNNLGQQLFYASQLARLHSSEIPPYHLFHKIDLSQELSNSEKMELSKFRTNFILLLKCNDSCDEVGVTYLAKTLAYVSSPYAGEATKNYILRSVDQKYENSSLIKTVKRVLNK